MTADATATKISGPAPAEQKAIAAVVQRMVTSWAKHDAAGIADLFIDDGALILPGVFKKGRDDIRAFFTAAYQGRYRGTKVTGQPIAIVALSKTSVALLTEGGVIADGHSELADADAIRASWVMVKQDGAWSLAVYHNCPRDQAA